MTLLSLSATAANALAASIWQGLLLVIAVALVLRLIPRIPAAARSLLWSAVFALVLALPFIPTHANASTATRGVAINPIWSIALAALWLTFSLMRAVQLVLSALALRRLARSATPVENHVSTYTLCTSPLVDRPSVVGFFSRRILLPPALYASLTPAELEHVLLHETEHLRRRDDWTNLVQKLALVLVPLNPVLLWVERRLCLERELACDDRVLRATGTPKAYATCLTHLAEHSLLRRSLILALGFFERQSELTRRVHRILQAPTQGMSPRQTAAATGALLVALACGSLQLAHAPQLIRFAAATPQLEAIRQPERTFTPSSNHITYQPAAFHIGPVNQSNVKFIQAIAPAPTQPTPQSKPRRVHHIIPRQAQPKLRAVVADWSEPTPPARMVLTTATYTRVSYTLIPAVAVATPNGWIIFQL